MRKTAIKSHILRQINFFFPRVLTVQHKSKSTQDVSQDAFAITRHRFYVHSLHWTSMLQGQKWTWETTFFDLSAIFFSWRGCFIFKMIKFLIYDDCLDVFLQRSSSWLNKIPQRWKTSEVHVSPRILTCFLHSRASIAIFVQKWLRWGNFRYLHNIRKKKLFVHTSETNYKLLLNWRLNVRLWRISYVTNYLNARAWAFHTKDSTKPATRVVPEYTSRSWEDLESTKCKNKEKILDRFSVEN